MPCLNEIQSISAEAQIIVSTEGDRGEATAPFHRVFQLTATQSGVPLAQVGLVWPDNNMAAPLSPVCEHMAGVCCSLLLSLPV